MTEIWCRTKQWWWRMFGWPRFHRRNCRRGSWHWAPVGFADWECSNCGLPR